jgi:hypothetical protein
MANIAELVQPPMTLVIVVTPVSQSMPPPDRAVNGSEEVAHQQLNKLNVLEDFRPWRVHSKLILEVSVHHTRSSPVTFPRASYVKLLPKDVGTSKEACTANLSRGSKTQKTQLPVLTAEIADLFLIQNNYH